MTFTFEGAILGKISRENDLGEGLLHSIDAEEEVTNEPVSNMLTAGGNRLRPVLHMGERAR